MMIDMNCAGKILTFNEPKIMGIVNVTPDSFFKTSRNQSVKDVLCSVEKMLKEGADLLDFGAFSSRPNAQFVSLDEEIQRIEPIIKVVSKEFPDLIISVDTFRYEVAKIVHESGAHIINDISFAADKKLIDYCSKNQLAYILMHLKGTPLEMMKDVVYKDVVQDVYEAIHSKVVELKTKGVEQVIIDPGFGFSKTMEQNYTLFSALEKFKALEKPVLVGISRKSMIYKLLETSPNEALNGTTILNTVALMKGASILRVHDVKEAVETRKILHLLN
jgi:dihydropteroate synthase